MKTDKPKSDFSVSTSPNSISDEENLKLETGERKIQKDRYRVLIEDVADGFYEVDLNGNFKFFNNALCRIFGYSKDEIQQRYTFRGQ